MSKVRGATLRRLASLPMMERNTRIVAALVLACAGIALAACAGASRSGPLAGATAAQVPPPSSAPAGAAQPGALAAPGTPGSATSPVPFRFFSPTSIWNESVAAGAALDPRSAQYVGALDALVASEQQTGHGPWINTKSYSVPVYTVPADQPTVRVTLTRPAPEPALQRAFAAVPLPSTAQPALGTDGELVLWQPGTDRLWEFWRLVHGPGGWQATWGGAMQNVSRASGVYGPQAWPGAQPWWGASASSLSLAGGLITLEDLQRGEINHALSVSLPNVRADLFAAPARRTDGKSREPLALPEGAHLRLDPALDLETLHLPRLTLMMARAAQRYGMYVRDGAKNVTFDAQDPVPTGTEPYGGASGYFEGSLPAALLAPFPWSHLELLKMELRSKRSEMLARQRARRHRREAARRRRRAARLRRRAARLQRRRALGPVRA